MERVLDQTRVNLHRLAEWGYPFSCDETGAPYLPSLHQGPEYMRLMRKQVKKAGAIILDHSPALELLLDADGRVAGANGIARQTGTRWTVQAGAVILASGGCAFLSKTLGCNVLTGDGYLMAAEVGAQLSGMEFSNVYGLSPAFATITKGAYYRHATFTTEDGTVIEGDRRTIARLLLQQQPVYACINKASPEEQQWMRTIQHNFFLPFERLGIDPFTQRFPVTLRLEGTVRGSGGLRIVDQTCATTVPGLYAAGDAASRELICGGASGGGSPNAAWATASGCWAGESAAVFARQLGTAIHQRSLQAAGTVAIRVGNHDPIHPADAIQAVQAEVLPLDHNLFRTEQGLSESLNRLHHLWDHIRDRTIASHHQAVQAREVAAMVATARWMYATALQRKESRGMHQHEDYPELNDQYKYRLISGGLDRIWVQPEHTFNREFATL
jgi:succinate dehydrogenase/fumarate reductase flavoprotein subunit